MGVKENIVNDVAVLALSGKLMGGDETWKIHNKVKNLISDNITQVVMDLSRLKWVNSQGLGMLMSCHTSLKNAEGNLKIAGATEKVQSLFMITKLITVFESYENTELAIKSFKQ